VRGSDPDAALYWFARMLAGGEHPEYIARRMARMAVEDIGLADPQALPTCIAAWEAYERMGSPEGELALAQACFLPARRRATPPMRRSPRQGRAQSEPNTCATRRRS
jgi:replication-associated recombination protein RarA